MNAHTPTSQTTCRAAGKDRLQAQFMSAFDIYGLTDLNGFFQIICIGKKVKIHSDRSEYSCQMRPDPDPDFQKFRASRCCLLATASYDVTAHAGEQFSRNATARLLPEIGRGRGCRPGRVTTPCRSAH